MPVVPTFSAFAKTPDLAGAAYNADQLRQRAVEAAINFRMQRERLAQEASADAARIQLGREQIEANRVENEMRIQATQRTLEREAIEKQHEAEISRAYNEARLGIDERRIAREEQDFQMRLENSARELQQRQAYDRARIRNIEILKMPEREASEAAMREVGAGMPGFAGSLTGREPSPFPGLNFKARQLDAQERSLMNKYPGYMAQTISDEDKAALADIQKQRRELQIPAGVQTSTATNPPPSSVSVTNAPGAGLTIPTGVTTNTAGIFQSTDEARKAGKKAGDVIYLRGVGKVRLK